MCRVVLPYAVFGVVVEDGKVTMAAPIGRWMIGKKLSYVKTWVERKGGEIEEGIS